jgi:hypothetical protein
MGNFFPALMPKYADPKTGDEAWPAGEAGYQQTTRYWLEAAYEEAKHDHMQNEEVQKVSKYIDYIMGKQWPAGRPTYKASPVNNRVWKLLWELVGLLTDIRPTFEIKNTADKEYDSHAQVLNKTIRAWWLDSDSDLQLAFIIIYAILTTGYAKLCWNEELQNGEGDLEILPLGPNDVLPLKAKNHIQTAQAVIYHSVQPLGFFKRKFPRKAHLVEPDPSFSRYASAPERPGHLPAMLYDNLSPAMKRIVGNPARVSNSAFPEAMYREFWIQDWTYNESNVSVLMGEKDRNWSYIVKPGERLYPRGRLLIMGGRAILHDGPNPYWHGKYPFGMLRMNAVPWQLMGLSDLNCMTQLQDIINNILAGVIDMIKKAVNPGFFAPKNAFTEGQWETMDWGMPGMKAAYSQVASQKPDFTQAPNLPSYVMQMMMLAAREMDTSSGIAAVNQAMQKKQVPSGESLDRIKEAQLTPIRLKGRNIEVFLRDLGSQQISNVFQFYDAKRRMFMLGQKGLTFEDFDWDPGSMIPDGARAEDHARRFKFMIEPDSLLNARRVEKAMIMLRLRLMGDMDRKHLYEILDLGYSVEDVEAELKREAQSGVPMHAGKGGKQPGGDMTKR